MILIFIPRNVAIECLCNAGDPAVPSVEERARDARPKSFAELDAQATPRADGILHLSRRVLHAGVSVARRLHRRRFYLWGSEGSVRRSGRGNAESDDERVSTQSVLEAPVCDACAVLYRVGV